MLKGHVLRCTDLVSYPRSCYVSSTSVTQFPICERRRRGQGWRFSLLRIHHLGWRQQRSLMSWPGSSSSTSQVVTASTKLCTSCPLSLQSYSPFVLHKEPRQRAKPRSTARPPASWPTVLAETHRFYLGKIHIYWIFSCLSKGDKVVLWMLSIYCLCTVHPHDQKPISISIHRYRCM